MISTHVTPVTMWPVSLATPWRPPFYAATPWTSDPQQHFQAPTYRTMSQTVSSTHLWTSQLGSCDDITNHLFIDALYWVICTTVINKCMHKIKNQGPQFQIYTWLWKQSHYLVGKFWKLTRDGHGQISNDRIDQRANSYQRHTTVWIKWVSFTSRSK